MMPSTQGRDFELANSTAKQPLLNSPQKEVKKLIPTASSNPTCMPPNPSLREDIVDDHVMMHLVKSHRD